MNDYKVRIAGLMKEKGLNLTDLAEAIGRGKATLSRYLSSGANQTAPGLDEFERMAKVFGVQAHWLAYGVGDRNTPADTLAKLVEGGACLVNVYTRSNVLDYLAGEFVETSLQMPVPVELSNCFGVVYPVVGNLSKVWDCVALIDTARTWVNNDLVLAQLGQDSVPEFFTLVRILDEVHVWYGDDTSKEPAIKTKEGNIKIIGVVSWGTWQQR